MRQTDHSIVGLSVEQKKVFSDTRGSLLHMIRVSEVSRPIAEVYLSTVNPGVTKGWKLHERMWQRFSVPVGEIEFQFIDDRPDSKTTGVRCSVRVSRENHSLVTVPPGVRYSFKCVSATEAVIVNAPDLEHDPSESKTLPLV